MDNGSSQVSQETNCLINFDVWLHYYLSCSAAVVWILAGCWLFQGQIDNRVDSVVCARLIMGVSLNWVAPVMQRQMLIHWSS